MAAEGLAMKAIKELFRLRLQARLSQEKVGLCINCGRTTVRDYEQRAKKAGLDTYDKIEVLTPGFQGS